MLADITSTISFIDLLIVTIKPEIDMEIRCSVLTCNPFIISIMQMLYELNKIKPENQNTIIIKNINMI